MGLIPDPINLDKFIFDINNLSSFSFSEKEMKYLEEKR